MLDLSHGSLVLAWRAIERASEKARGWRRRRSNPRGFSRGWPNTLNLKP